MGGDNAPRDIVHGGVEAARHANGRFHVVLVGDEEQIKKEIERHFHTADLPISIVHAPQVVEMDDHPAIVLKQKIDSSIGVAMRLHRDGEVGAMVSAGNTGAVMASALFTLKRIPGIRRPAIGSILPAENGRVLALDMGANVDSRPEDLVEFAIMGSVFYGQLFDEPNPTVGLLSIGHEAVKGNELTSQANALLWKSPINFVGNVEGGDILKGTTNVVVCDGFVGNVVLKFAESLHGLFKSSMRLLVKKYLFSKIGAVLMKPTFNGIRKIFDYQEYGGAPLLGVQGVCVIGHGRSTPRAIQSAILAAVKLVGENVNQHILEKIAADPGK